MPRKLFQPKHPIFIRLEIRKREVELERWYERGIDELSKIALTKHIVRDASATGIEITGAKSQIESFQKQWDLDVSKFEVDYNHSCARLDEAILSAKKSIEQINAVITNRKNSLFEWLNENKPGWEKTIGKVINQEQVLFHSGLSPRNTRSEPTNLYGVEIDLEEITTTVKTIGDYEKEIRKHEDQIKKSETTLRSLAENKVKEQDKNKKKYPPQIKSLKELVALKEYESQKAISVKDQVGVQLDDYKRKAKEEKMQRLHQSSKKLKLQG